MAAESLFDEVKRCAGFKLLDEAASKARHSICAWFATRLRGLLFTALRCARPCAAVVDLRLRVGPDGDGPRQLRARFSGLSLVVVSGLDTAAPELCPSLFRKPVEMPELLAALDRLHARNFRAP